MHDHIDDHVAAADLFRALRETLSSGLDAITPRGGVHLSLVGVEVQEGDPVPVQVIVGCDDTQYGFKTLVPLANLRQKSATDASEMVRQALLAIISAKGLPPKDAGPVTWI